MIFGGIYSSTRQAIKGPAVVEGKTLYIYPEQYEGQESDPLIFCTGPVPAQQVEPLIPWLMEQDGREDVLPALGRLHLAARAERRRSARWSRRSGGEIVEEEYFPARSRRLRRDRRADHLQRRGRGLQHDRPARADAVLRSSSTTPASRSAAGSSSARTSTRTASDLLPAEQVEGLYGCLDYYQAVDDPFSQELLDRYDGLFPGSALFTGGSACSGLYRGLRLWEAAVTRGGLARPGRRDRGARPREDRRGPRRPGGDGARSAPRPDEHVHRAGARTARSRSSRASGSSIPTSSRCTRSGARLSRDRWTAEGPGLRGPRRASNAGVSESPDPPHHQPRSVARRSGSA